MKGKFLLIYYVAILIVKQHTCHKNLLHNSQHLSTKLIIGTGTIVKHSISRKEYNINKYQGF